MPQKYLMANQTLFKDLDVFEFDYTPDTINYRDIQLRQLAEAVRPTLHGGRPINTVIRGPPGTGKTTSVRQIFSEIEAATRHIIPVLINCQTVQTEFRVYRKIYEAVFHQQPPVSGISVQRLFDAIGRELCERDAVLLVCLDDANFLFHDHLLEKVLRSLLRMHEEYPGIRTGVIVTVSNIDIPIPRLLSASVISVFQPNEVFFPPYGEEEVRAILYDRVRAGLYPNVISPDILDDIVEETMRGKDLRMGISLLKRSVLWAECDARKAVTRADVQACVQPVQDLHLDALIRVLSEDERQMLGQIATLHRVKGESMVSGDLFRALQKQVPMCYTLFFERLEKFRNMGLIDMYRPRIRGNTRKIVLRYDAGKVRDLCSTR